MSSRPSYWPGITMSTPKGRSPTCSSIHWSSISSSSGLKPTAPRTPKPPALETAATTSRQWVKAKIGNSMSSTSQSWVRMSVLPGQWCGGREAERHRLDAVHEVGGEASDGTRQLEVGQPLDELAHGRLDLGAGEAGAEAVVHPAPAEGDVVVGGAADVEGVRVVEDILVAVGGGVVEDDLVAGGDRHAPQLGGARGGATEVVDRAAPAEHFVDRRVPEAGVVAQARSEEHTSELQSLMRHSY